MAEVKVYYDKVGNTLTVWFGDRHQEYICEETGDEVILMKNKAGIVIGFEKLTSGITQKLTVEFIHTPAYSPDFNLAEYKIHLLRLEKLHHLPSNVTIAEIKRKLEDVKILMNSEQILNTLNHIFSLVPIPIS